ncbi:MAG TPA: hypothetical protein VK348_02605 [Planctomycetota bacterium]|nr:hypothetical protein [Planctomycetota bacterium]
MLPDPATTTPRPPTRAQRWRRRWFWLPLLLLVYLPVGSNPGWYNQDELQLLHDLQTWSWRMCVPAIDHGHDLFYRPFGFAAFALQLQLSDGVAQVAHLLSVLHHLANALLFAWVLRRLGRSPWPALWLLVLPTAVPAVAWVAAVYDRLLLTVLLLAAGCLVRAKPAAALAAVALFVVALGTKETAVVFPAVALLLVWRGTAAGRAAAWTMLALAFAFVSWRLLAGAHDPTYQYRLDAGALRTLLCHAAFPFALDSDDPGHCWGLSWLGLLPLVLLLALASRRQPRQLAIALLLALLPMLPVFALARPEGHTLLLSTVALALVLDLAITAPGPGWTSVLGWLLAGLLLAHTVVIGCSYRSDGVVMRNLQAAHRTLAPAPSAGRILVDAAARGWVVERFALFTRTADLRPRLWSRDGQDGLPVLLHLRSDGSAAAVR